ncbi:MAG: HIT family protein [Acidiferrobacterales bacterium]|nr:HIT family protein [Acidiferrobacterales bacterium]
MPEDANCIFCGIVAGQIPSIKIYENAQVLAFMDINPVSTGHVLVIPKGHWRDLFDMPDEQLGLVAAAVRKVAQAVKTVLNPDGISITQANGKGAAQSVLHYHVHIVARTMGDELKINWELVAGDMDAIGAVASRIRQQLEP